VAHAEDIVFLRNEKFAGEASPDRLLQKIYDERGFKSSSTKKSPTEVEDSFELRLSSFLLCCFLLFCCHCSCNAHALFARMNKKLFLKVFQEKNIFEKLFSSPDLC